MHNTLIYKHKSFSSLAFIKEPQKIEIDGAQVNYLSFCLPENFGKTPLVFLGGAFQNFLSFKREVKVLLEDFPILLIDLPSQGKNEQLVPDWGFADFATTLAKFQDRIGVDKIIPIALSYGSAVGLTMATLFPQKIEKLIIGGTTPKIRESFHHLLSATIDVMDEGRMDLFSEGVVMNLINYSKRNITKIPDRIIKGFYKNMMGLTENEKTRYKHNTQRLLDMSDLPIDVECKTLVFTGEYDNFTTPYENYQIAKVIPKSHFCLVKDGDHLSQLERRDVMVELYKRFALGESIDQLEGIRNFGEKSFEGECRRIDDRPKAGNIPAQILQPESGQKILAELIDINNQGCCLKITSEAVDFLDSSEFFDLEITGFQELNLSIFPITKGEITRCVFRKGNFIEGEKLETYVEGLRP